MVHEEGLNLLTLNLPTI